MTQAPDLPLWAAILTAFFLLAGALITAIGSFGLVRLKSFYGRVHAPTLGTTLASSAKCVTAPSTATSTQATVMAALGTAAWRRLSTE